MEVCKHIFHFFKPHLCIILPRLITSAGSFLDIAGDYLRLPAFNYTPATPTSNSQIFIKTQAPHSGKCLCNTTSGDCLGRIQ